MLTDFDSIWQQVNYLRSKNKNKVALRFRSGSYFMQLTYSMMPSNILHSLSLFSDEKCIYARQKCVPCILGSLQPCRYCLFVTWNPEYKDGWIEVSGSLFPQKNSNEFRKPLSSITKTSSCHVRLVDDTKTVDDTNTCNWNNLNQGLSHAGMVDCLLRNQRLCANTTIILHTALLVS
jgi:hypothetical protein